MGSHLEKALTKCRKTLDFRTYWTLSKRTKAWIYQESLRNNRKIVFDMESFWERMAIIWGYENEVEEFLESTNQEYIKNYYEDITGADREKQFSRIFQFLGVSAFNVDFKNIHLKRQNPEGIRDLVVNYSEICHSLAESDYAWMLKE